MFEEYGEGIANPSGSQTTPQDGRQMSASESPQFRTVGRDRGIVCYCAGVECVFEMELYRYMHKQERREVPYGFSA